MNRLIYPVVAVSALIVLTDALFSDARTAPASVFEVSQIGDRLVPATGLPRLPIRN